MQQGKYFLPASYRHLIFEVNKKYNAEIAGEYLYGEWLKNKDANEHFTEKLKKEIEGIEEGKRKNAPTTKLIDDENENIPLHLRPSLQYSEFDLEKINEGFKHFAAKIKGIKGVKQFSKIPWYGELKEFAELIDSLESGKWTEIPDGELKAKCETFCACFDFSLTQKKEGSNTVNSLMQYLKPSERDAKIYSKRYTKKFNSISPNPKEN